MVMAWRNESNGAGGSHRRNRNNNGAAAMANQAASISAEINAISISLANIIMKMKAHRKYSKSSIMA
jgi:hypothetical protein